MVRGVSEMKRNDPTENELAEAEYVSDYCGEFLTDDEHLARRIRSFESKSPVDENDPASQAFRDRLMATVGKHHSQAEIERARQIVNRGMSELSMALRERVLREAPELIARCRKCDGVLRTPQSRQCRWCRDDWHSSSD